MSHIKVVLKKDMPNLGKEGEIVEVKAGYGRNFLLNKNFAIFLDTPEGKALIAKNQSERQEVSKGEKSKEEKILSLAGQIFKFEVKVNKKGKPFRAIQKKDIAKKIGIEEEKIITGPIKELGQHQVVIKTQRNNIEIKVDILPEK